MLLATSWFVAIFFANSFSNILNTKSPFWGLTFDAFIASSASSNIWVRRLWTKLWILLLVLLSHLPFPNYIKKIGPVGKGPWGEFPGILQVGELLSTVMVLRLILPIIRFSQENRDPSSSLSNRTNYIISLECNKDK